MRSGRNPRTFRASCSRKAEGEEDVNTRVAYPIGPKRKYFRGGVGPPTQCRRHIRRRVMPINVNGEVFIVAAADIDV